MAISGGQPTPNFEMAELASIVVLKGSFISGR
jgi:hypothetical protein